MKVIYLVPGAGGRYYCENCLRDLPLINALRREGIQAEMIPLYLPVIPDMGNGETESEVYFGAINYYLDMQFPGFRKAPGWLRNMMDSRILLKAASFFDGATNPDGLERMTLSMIAGEYPEDFRSLSILEEHLRTSAPPQVIHISNILLLGLGVRLKRDLKVPLVCTLQDEDIWLDGMREPYRDEAYRMISAHAEEVDKFISVSGYFADKFLPSISVSPGEAAIIPIGITPEKYQTGTCSGTSDREHPGETDSRPLRLGYLYRMKEGYGLDRLARAYKQLIGFPELSDLQLHISGGYTSSDLPFIQGIKRMLRQEIHQGDVQFHSSIDLPGRIQFLESLDLLSVPLEKPEAFGSYLIESLAMGVPVVQPSIGAFPEIIRHTGGGRLFTRDEELVTELFAVLTDSESRKALGSAGQKSVYQQYTTEKAARKTVSIYRTLTENL